MRSRPAGALVAGALLLALTACSSDEPEAAAPAASEAARGVSEGGDSGAGVEEFDPEQVLVEQTLTDVADERDTLDVAVTSLQVEDKVMRLELAVTPDRASVSDSEKQSIYDLRGFFDYPSLVDRVNLKRYDVLRAGPGQLYATDVVDTKTVNGRAARVYFYYAAPEDDIDTIDVVLSDTYPAFTDVPISR